MNSNVEDGLTNSNSGREDSLAMLQMHLCPACGAKARRRDAQFCYVCGRAFDRGADYLPADSIRASYHHQHGRRRAPAFPTRPGSSTPRARKLAESPTLFAKNNNGMAATALAFVTYAIVPYLGILFCPGAVVMGGLGLLCAQRAPHRGGRRASVFSIVMGLVILGVQIFLWWILYKIPEWSRPGGF